MRDQVGAAADEAFVEVDHRDALAGADRVGLRGAVHLALEHTAEVFGVVLDHAEDAFDRVTRDALFDVETVGFVVLEEDVGLVDAAEEVVEVAHDVLVGADHEGTDVVGLAFLERV